MLYNDIYLNSLDENLLNILNLEQLENKTILITGATGLIGSNIVDLLLRANKTYRLNTSIVIAARCKLKVKDRFCLYNEGIDYIFEQYDANEEFTYENPLDFIIHAASNASPELYVREPVNTMLSNILGTNELLKIAVKNKHCRFLFVSSSEVYGKTNLNKELTEDTIGYVEFLNERASYPVSKQASETLCKSYMNQYGQDIIIVRPGHIYGPTMTENDNRVHAQFARCGLKKKEIVLKSSGSQVRSYTYSFDASTAILTVLLNGVAGEAYNISNSNSIASIKELAETIAVESGVRIKYENPNNEDKVKFNSMINSSLNSNKIEQLGWRGMYSLKQGIKEMLLILKR